MVLDGEPEVHEAAFRELTAFVYCEPSNKNWDAQSEKVLQTALAASLAHYLALGNIDIDHLSLLGPRHGLTPAEAKLYEIGVPAQVLTAPKILVCTVALWGSPVSAAGASSSGLSPRCRGPRSP